MLTSTQAANSTEPVTLAGRTFPARQLRFHEWADLQAWLKSTAPNPVTLAVKALADLEGQGTAVPQALQKAVIEQAQEESRRWPPRIGTAAWLRALEDTEGGRWRFLRAALAAGGTDLDESEAAEIFEAATKEELGELMRICLHGDPIVPKSAGAPRPPRRASTWTSGAGFWRRLASSVLPGLTRTSAT